MYKKELEIAIQAAREAGKLLRAGGNMTIDSMEGKDIKLSSDRDSEQKIFATLRSESAYPILSEESGRIETGDTTGHLWIVDPLDGTANYFKGLTELTCVSIALWKDGHPVLGVIYRYVVDELYYGIVGSGAYCNEVQISTSEIACVKEAVLATGLPVHRDYHSDSLLDFVRTIQQFKKIRMLGAAAVMGAFVAAGRLDAYWEDHIMLWDIAASAAIVRSAGGEVDIQFLEDNMCVCKLFANHGLMEDFNAKSL